MDDVSKSPSVIDTAIVNANIITIDPQRPRAEALAISGAYASFEEKIKGSIEVGKLADLVVLGADPTMVNPHTIKNIPIEQTMVGGKVVYEK